MASNQSNGYQQRPMKNLLELSRTMHSSSSRVYGVINSRHDLAGENKRQSQQRIEKHFPTGDVKLPSLPIAPRQGSAYSYPLSPGGKVHKGQYAQNVSAGPRNKQIQNQDSRYSAIPETTSGSPSNVVNKPNIDNTLSHRDKYISSGGSGRAFGNYENTNPQNLPKLFKLFEKIENFNVLAEESKEELKDYILQMENIGVKPRDEAIFKEIAELRDLNRRLETEVKERNEMKEIFEHMKHDYEGLKVKEKEECTILEQQKLDLRNLSEENTTLKRDLSRTKLQLTKIMQENDKHSAELLESKSRLSRLMGNRLSDNNPDIADLSDRNRPTKLAEKYQELYDEQWTNAFEVFEKKFNNEKKSILNLKQVLENIKRHCDKMSKHQHDTLLESFTIKKTGMNMPNDILKQLKELRKVAAGLSLKGVYEQFLDDVKKNSSETFVSLLLDDKVLPFIKGCTELCWLMSVQDPPLVFGTDPNSTEPLDTNIYKFYTMSGKYCEYVVWPPLYLYKDGPLLSKGIAQGFTPHENIKPRTSQRGEVPTDSSDISTGACSSDAYIRRSNNANRHDANTANTNEIRHNVEQRNHNGYHQADRRY